MPGKSLRRFRKDNNHLEKSDGCILNFCKLQKRYWSMDNALQHYIFMYVYIFEVQRGPTVEKVNFSF